MMNCRIQTNALLPFLLVVVAFAAILGCKRPGDGSLRYETARVSRGDIVQRVTASGSLCAVVSVDVGSQVSGKISSLRVDFNSPVTKGQIVAQIDPTVYEAALRQAEGELASAKATATLKRQNLDRKKTLLSLNAAAQSDLDQAVAELAQADATVSIREAASESARANLGYCKITAPVDGIVISRKVDIGQTVIAAMSTPVLFTVAQDIAKMNISASVSEADIGWVSVGQSVEFTVDAFPDATFHGTVAQVRKAPTTTQNVVTYETIIFVENPEEKLFPGMTANVSILVSERKGVLKVPNTALRYTPPEQASFEQIPPRKLDRSQRLIYTPSANGIQIKPLIIKSGISDGMDTEIVDGLAEGAQVVVSTRATDVKKSGFGAPPPQAPQ